VGQGKLKLSLDSSIFRNRRFLEWVRYTKKHNAHVSIIVYVETLLWYKALGLTKGDFDNELAEAGIAVIELTESLADRVTANALKHRKAFPFKHHARDYVIGTTALENEATLITYNLDDFKWVQDEGGTVHTPESFLSAILE
jgi:predicted nucleic acid-binding protein